MEMQAGVWRAFLCATARVFSRAVAILAIGALLAAVPSWTAPAHATERIYLDDDAAQDRQHKQDFQAAFKHADDSQCIFSR